MADTRPGYYSPDDNGGPSAEHSAAATPEKPRGPDGGGATLALASRIHVPPPRTLSPMLAAAAAGAAAPAAPIPQHHQRRDDDYDPDDAARVAPSESAASADGGASAAGASSVAPPPPAAVSDERGCVHGALICESQHAAGDDDFAWNRHPPRRHAWHQPFHTRQIAAWVAKAVVIALYGAAVAWPLDALTATTASGDRALTAGVNALVGAELVACIALAVVVTTTEPGLPDVGDDAAQSHGRARFCSFCRRDVHEDCKHCKSCNRCARGFDHHCRWLNCCIGADNGRCFFWYLATLVASVATMFALAVALLALHGDALPAVRYGFAVLAATLLGAALLPVAHLFGYHVFLWRVGMTTFQHQTLPLPPQMP